MRIQHNIAALNSNRQLGSNNKSVASNLEKLSSGYRINRAGDDAAGLAISEKMRAQITGLETAQKNANDGISLVQTAEGALTEVHSMLNRMVELADQSANGTYDNSVDRANLQKELDSLKTEINRISEGTNFNGINLLDGSLGSGTAGAAASVVADTTAKTDAFSFEISGAEGTKVSFASKVDAANDKSVSAAFDSDGNLTITLGAKAAATITQKDIDDALSKVAIPESAKGLKVTLKSDIKFNAASADQATIVGSDITSAAAKNATASDTTNGITVTSTKAGANTNKLTFDNTGNVGVTVAANGDVSVNLGAGKNYTSAEINSMLADAGANMTVSFDGQKSDAALKASGTAGAYTLAGGSGLESGGGLVLQIGDTAESFNQLSVSVGAMDSTSLGIGSVDISTQKNAQNAVALIKTAINTVSSTRGDLGAIQNRLDHTINNLSVTTENMTAAESRIRDVDMAKEMMEYTKNNILVQASQAMLAQANQLPQGVLQLLQ